MEHWAKMGYYTLAETLQSKNITQHSRLKIGLCFSCNPIHLFVNKITQILGTNEFGQIFIKV